MLQELPKFNKPPVIETVLGVEFEPLSNFLIPHFGLFLLDLKDSYSSFKELPPLDSQIEKFEGDSIEIASFQLGFRSEIRCLFLDAKQEWRLQIQNNKFLSNWAKSTSKYPSYDETLRRFKTNWGKFNLFLEKSRIEKPQIKQCEVTYLNHIEDIDNFENLSEIFPSWKKNGKKTDFLPTPEAIAINLVYRIPENRGRLHISMQPAVRHADLKRIIQLSLVARVLPKSSKRNDVLEALNLGHEWVVRGFTDFTSEKMHQIWERR
jgi:uncharacterized protein (TIGR04255 family)